MIDGLVMDGLVMDDLVMDDHARGQGERSWKGFLSDRSDFFCQVNSDGTPGDAPATAHAAGRAKLGMPTVQFMRQPLSVSCRGVIANEAAPKIAEIGIKTGIPSSLALDTIQVQVRDFGDGRTKTGRTDHRAIRA